MTPESDHAVFNRIYIMLTNKSFFGFDAVIGTT